MLNLIVKALFAVGSFIGGYVIGYNVTLRLVQQHCEKINRQALARLNGNRYDS